MPADLFALAPDPLTVARPLSWVVVTVFLGGAVLERRDRDLARPVAVAGWVLFGAFWLVLVPHFVFEIKSVVEGVGSVAAAPLSFYAGYLLWRGRDSLFVLSRAVGLMGVLYLPFAYVPLLESNPLRRWLVETVTAHTAALLAAAGSDPTVLGGLEYRGAPVPAKTRPYESTFLFPGDSRPITYTILIACTGVGSVAIVAGAVLAVSAPVGRKLRALAVSVPVVYVLNLFRNAFIAISFGEQRMQWFVEPTMTVFGLEDPQLVSYYFADRLLAQFGSVVAMAAVVFLVVRQLPAVLTMVEDLLYLVTGAEYDLATALDDDRTSPEAPADD